MKKGQDNPKILKNKYVPTTEFYSQIIDSLQDYSFFTLDEELVINSWSSGTTKIVGYETDEVIGEHFDLIFTEEDLKNGIQLISGKNLFSKKSKASFETVSTDKPRKNIYYC